MQMLVQEIESALENHRHFFLRPDDLKRLWPSGSEQEREDTVRDFAREHGWRIFSYSRALGAMFVGGPMARDASESSQTDTTARAAKVASGSVLP
jgi:hypothetical protein